MLKNNIYSLNIQFVLTDRKTCLFLFNHLRIKLPLANKLGIYPGFKTPQGNQNNFGIF